MAMIEKNKELLLKDLCARLPYGVKVTNGIQVITLKVRIDTAPATLAQFIHSENLRYYLRPMSSMTEEEYEQYRKFSYYGAAGYRNNDYKEMVATPSFEKMDFLNAHHFDYRGLIEKGLALEAPEGMYNVK